MPATQLKNYLDRHGIKYVSIAHSPAYTIQEVAESTHIPGNQMAKTVIVQLDGKMAMAVLPGNQKIVMQDLRDVTGSEHAKLVPELSFRMRFPDCDIGAMPPFGNLYGMEVYAASTLAQNDDIAFNAGSHSEVIKMAYADFERLVHPKILSFAG